MMKSKTQNVMRYPPLFIRCQAKWANKPCCGNLVPRTCKPHRRWNRRICRECQLKYDNYVLKAIVESMEQINPKLQKFIHAKYLQLTNHSQARSSKYKTKHVQGHKKK